MKGLTTLVFIGLAIGITSLRVNSLKANICPSTHNIQPSNALSFFRIVGKLKTLKRTGWVNHSVALPESVADHMYRMTMMSMMIKDNEIDRDRLMKICLVHDLAESIIGDITPHDKRFTKEQKRQAEEKALRSIAINVNDKMIEDELIELWLEYENCNTKEAKIAKNLDKFEMILQADEYEQSQSKTLDDFFESTKDSFDHPEVKSWNELLRFQRQQRQQRQMQQS